MISFDFQKHEQKAKAFLKEVASEIGTDDMARTGRILTAVMHGLRDRITPQESLDLISQLPVFIRAAYIDGWKISDKIERTKTRKNFFKISGSMRWVASSRMTLETTKTFR